MLSDIL